ncbi:MAG TPA: histidinol-phosphate transaminase [Acidisarcina sp.]|nr:histidinol-phosphate transaminase [Acidisarcina sp.]
MRKLSAREAFVVDRETMTGPSPRRAVRLMKEYHPPLGGRDSLRLDFNENTVACSPAVLKLLERIAASDLTKYPERETVEAAAATHLGLKQEQVVLTNGVDEAIHVLCGTYMDAGDEMLLPVPTYTMYEVYASGTDGRAVTVQAGEDFAFPAERLLAAITPSTKIIAIANPNSPTGTTVSREEILAIAARAPHAIVLVDEAYFHFFGETVADLIGTVPNLMLARTFSKAYGLAGLRLGLLAGTRENMQWIRRVISPYSVNSVALACLPPALEDTAYLEWYVEEVCGAREEFKRGLNELGVHWWPSQANFVLTRIGVKHKDFVAAMHRRGVLVRDRSADPGCDGCVRVTVGTREQMRQAIGAFRASLEEIQWSK